MILETATFRSPIGTITLLAKEQALAGLDFGDRDARVRALRRHLERWLGPFELRKTRDPAGAVSRLRAYFAGEITALDSQPVVLLGTPFQVEVWTALRTIPAGRTWSYRNLAERLGRPQAVPVIGHVHQPAAARTDERRIVHGARGAAIGMDTALVDEVG